MPTLYCAWRAQVGGGTGYNIEKMNSFLSVPDFFSAIYLVDLSPSLLDVARERFRRLGWKNVHVVCEDARTFTLGGKLDALALEGGEKHAVKADFITLSYSLSMIPECVISYLRFDHHVDRIYAHISSYDLLEGQRPCRARYHP